MALRTAFAFGLGWLALGLCGCSSDSTVVEEEALDGSSAGGAKLPDGAPGTGGKGTAGSAGKAGAGGGSTGGAKGSGGSGVPSDAGPSVPSCSTAPVATAPASAWVNSTGNLANMPSECGNLGLVSAMPCSKAVIAGVAKMGLHFTEDGGKTWNPLGTGASSAAITNRISSIVYDPDNLGTFWESGIYNGGGVYKTTDSGVTFEQVGDVTHNDSVSVDLKDPARATLIAGPHETSAKFYLSTDSGATWDTMGSSLPGNAGFSIGTLVLSSSTLLIGCTDGSNGGVFRSTDTGVSFTRVGTKGVTNQPLWAASGAIYWPGSQGGVQKSADGGLTFTEVASSSIAPGVVAPTTLAELPDGRIVVLGKDHLQATADGGTTWKAIGDAFPSGLSGGGYGGFSGVTYSAQTKTFFIWRWDCGNVVPADGIWSAGFDYTTQ